MKIRSKLAVLCIAPALIMGPVISSAAADPGCSITPTGSEKPGITSFSIKFTKTCGYTVRTFIHFNNFPLGTTWVYGNNVNGQNVTSAQGLPLKTNRYCSYGYQYQYAKGKWSSLTTGGVGC